MTGKITLTDQLDHPLDILNFYLAEGLKKEVILGCDFYETHVEDIRPRRRNVDLEYRNTVPTVQKHNKRLLEAPPLP